MGVCGGGMSWGSFVLRHSLFLQLVMNEILESPMLNCSAMETENVQNGTEEVGAEGAGEKGPFLSNSKHGERGGKNQNH